MFQSTISRDLTYFAYYSLSNISTNAPTSTTTDKYVTVLRLIATVETKTTVGGQSRLILVGAFMEKRLSHNSIPMGNLLHTHPAVWFLDPPFPHTLQQLRPSSNPNWILFTIHDTENPQPIPRERGPSLSSTDRVSQQIDCFVDALIRAAPRAQQRDTRSIFIPKRRGVRNIDDPERELVKIQ